MEQSCCCTTSVKRVPGEGKPWVAAGKGTFGTGELIHRIEASGLAEVVEHRRVIVPQLGAPGVAAHEVKKAKERKTVITDRNRCMECSACMRNSAFGALTVDNGVGCAAALFFSMLTGKEPACGCSDDASGGCC